MIFYQEFKDIGTIPPGDQPIPGQIIISNDNQDPQNKNDESTPVQIETILEGNIEDYRVSGIEDTTIVQEMILKAAENVVSIDFISEQEFEGKPQQLNTYCTGILVEQLDIDGKRKILLETVAHCIPPRTITELYINGQLANGAYTISQPNHPDGHRDFAEPRQDKAYIIYNQDTRPNLSNTFNDLNFSNISPNDLLAMAHHFDTSFFQIGFRRRSQEPGVLKRIITPLRLSYYEEAINDTLCTPESSYMLTFNPKTIDGTTYKEQGGSSGGPIIAFMDDTNRPTLFSTVSFAGSITNTQGSNYTIIGQLATPKDYATNFVNDPINTFTSIGASNSMLIPEKEFPIVSTTIYNGPIVSALINEGILSLDLSLAEKNMLYQATLKLLIYATQQQINKIKLTIDLSGNLSASVCDIDNQELSYRYQWPTQEWIKRGETP